MSGFAGWNKVAVSLRDRAHRERDIFDDGQRAAIRAIADRLITNGVILADEVGMGKTRVAVAVVNAVVGCGGRVMLAIPPGLDYQWQEELRYGGVYDTPITLRTMDGYIAAWPMNGASHPWSDRAVVSISHRFATWKIGSGASWRWQLLPALYAHWQKEMTGRFPRASYMYDESHWNEKVMRAATEISAKLCADPTGAAANAMAATANAVAHSDIMRSESYGRGPFLRPHLERVVGLGLGAFDLIVVDEAHKSRKETSGLERLLENMIISSPDARRIAVTATPVELSVAQWGQILHRVKAADITAIEKSVERYAHALGKVRLLWQSDSTARQEFAEAALQFQTALSPYLVRRDKREEKSVVRFVEQSKEPHDAYRLEREINISPSDLSYEWKQAICAAEALSFVATGSDPIAKRLRLTMGNGHAISSIIDRVFFNPSDDTHQEQHESEQNDNLGRQLDRSEPDRNIVDAKRSQRVSWWQNLVATAIPDTQKVLYDHPAVLAAVQEIEEYTKRGQKVLVFGRFTRPMQALTSLLNSRAMLTALENNEAWPQSKVHEEDRASVAVALRQLGSEQDLIAIDDRLGEQYRQIESRREVLRANLGDWIIEGLAASEQLELDLIEAALESKNPNVRPLLARAVDELIDKSEDLGPMTCARAFVDLVSALRDRASEKNSAATLWPAFERTLLAEFNFQRGTFARLMFGGTSTEGRRALQLAFNRKNSFPSVLVAQSMVGREGLNLHLACRVVVLLHPEWNPGVVEQQIGRVDRIGSRWENELEIAISKGCDLPRIEIRPVIFSGTYDEHNWAVLRARWSELRAQLHGVIIDHKYREGDFSPEIITWLEEAAPDFRPSAI